MEDSDKAKAEELEEQSRRIFDQWWENNNLDDPAVFDTFVAFGANSAEEAEWTRTHLRKLRDSSLACREREA